MSQIRTILEPMNLDGVDLTVSITMPVYKWRQFLAAIQPSASANQVVHRVANDISKNLEMRAPEAKENP